MFRYNVEITSCALWASSPNVFLELKCPRRGARCRIDHLPGEVVIRSAPAADTLVLSLVRDGRVTAVGDAIEIGIPHRCVGARTVQLLPVAGSLESCCEMNVMWSVEAEDGSVFTMPAEEYDMGERSPESSSSVSTALPTVEDRDDTDKNERTVLKETHKSAERGKRSDVSNPVFRCSATTSSTEPTENPLGVGNPILRDPNLSVEGAATNVTSPLSGLPWFLHGPQHAPEGSLDYYVTSTQVVARPEAWSNLYTSPSPLLEDKKSEGHLSAIDKKVWPFGGVYSSGHRNISAIESIIRDPTESLELPSDEAFKQELCRRIKAPQGRKKISFTAPKHTAKSRR